MRCGLLALFSLLAACDPAATSGGAPAPAGGEPPAAAAGVPPAAQTTAEEKPKDKAKDGLVDWTPPDHATIPEGPLGDSVKRGLDLFTHTSERLPDYTPTTLNCSSCHLDAGRKPYAAPVVGSYARFPKYMPRTEAVITMQERVNHCMTRSMAGIRLPADSQEMVDLVNYIAWLSKDIPVGSHITAQDLPTLPRLEGDAANGERLFGEKCVACHQKDGGGIPGAFPALWGPRSYSIGASMARHERAASFIKMFMPQTAPGTLSDQEAYDLAAFVNSHPRPDSPNKENDWPAGGAPYDVPYATKGHEAYRPPAELLPRAKAEQSQVLRPVSVQTSKASP
jgi:thiosulfate dehydrogenase